MATITQITRKKRKKKRKLNRTPGLEKCPQKLGLVIKLIYKSPRKPNSALRRIVKITLMSHTKKKRVFAYIPGESFGAGFELKTFARVLVRGGRVPDLPGVKYRLIRNKLDLLGVRIRKTSRSKYGVKKKYY